MNPVLIHLRPWDLGLGDRIDVRIADGPSANAYGVGGFRWEPAIFQRPKLSFQIIAEQMTGKIQAGTATFAILLGNIRAVAMATKLHWRGAPVTIRNAPDYSLNGSALEFSGRVTSARYDNDRKLMTVEAQVSTNLIQKPLLPLSYTGGGGLNGDPELRGVLRPAGFGLCENIPPVWFDTTDNIGQIDGYGNCLSITRLMEGASDLGPKVANYANYAALKAAITGGAVPAGRWASCHFDGLVGLGAPPVGVIGANASFSGGLPGSFARRMMEVNAGIDVSKIDTAAFDALDVSVPYPVHYWTSSQRQVNELLEALAASCNATPLVTFQEKVTITRAVTTAPVGTLDRSGQTNPRVLQWQSAEIDAPFYQMKARAARPAGVLTIDQVLYEDDLLDKGVYDPATTYYRGNLVWDDYGAQYLYQNATPAAGQPLPVPPATSTPYWFLRRAAPTPVYDDGTDINTLRPAAAGADVTEDNTAAAIVGQGTGATANTLEDLDPVAREELDSALAGGGASYAYGEYKKVTLDAGQSVTVSGQIYINAGGSSSGSVQANLVAGPNGGSLSTFGTGSVEPVTPTEPATTTVGPSTFTNTTGVKQIFQIGLALVRTPGTAGGSVDTAMSYFS